MRHLIAGGHGVRSRSAELVVERPVDVASVIRVAVECDSDAGKQPVTGDPHRFAIVKAHASTEQPPPARLEARRLHAASRLTAR